MARFGKNYPLVYSGTTLFDINFRLNLFFGLYKIEEKYKRWQVKLALMKWKKAIGKGKGETWVSKKRNAMGLRVALASYDVRQLRVWSRYLEERNAELSCEGYRTGEELLLSLRQGEPFDVVVLGGQLGDMDAMTFLERAGKLEQKPFFLLMNEGRREKSAAASLDIGGSCYLVRQTSLKDLLGRLNEMPSDARKKIEAGCQELYSRWGIPQPDTNCEYLTQAVCTAFSSKDKMAIRKEILQQVAEQQGMKIVAVDSGLRRLVDTLELRQSDGWKAFKRASHLDQVKVTTGKLIYAVKYVLEQDAQN